MKKIEEKKTLLDLIITSADSQKKIFDYLTFLDNLKHLELDTKTYSLTKGLGQIHRLIETQVAELRPQTNRSFAVQTPPVLDSGSMILDLKLLNKSIKDVLINGIKYSSEAGEIRIGFLVETNPRVLF